MLERITHPELYVDAERAGADWIGSQKKGCGELGEVIKSFFSLENTEFSRFTNILFKYGGLAVAGASFYFLKDLERTDNPLFYGSVLLAFGILGLSATSLGVRSSMERRKIIRERKASVAATSH